MMDWLLDTLVWTAALIALVLLIRRPVARWFGPQFAYALWALPLLRLLMPPLTLPAWLAPVEPATTSVPASDSTGFMLVEFAPAPFVEPAAPQLLPYSLQEIALAAWLTGAAIFLYLRFRSYHRMRQDLLAEAREVGRAGKVRLVETPLTGAPLAFGVIDKVVAMPRGFLADWDREARDLALAHELAHHQGQDLLINMAAQPLFALHWFNPLGHLGWLAMRRDQEAACDARVLAARGPAERAAYAKVIASFAAGPNVALAAPMACPVLGDKSIIQRLRSIKMNNHSNSQRWLGRGVLAAALLAMPLTATISYAEPAPAPEVAPIPPLPPVPPVPPVPPAPMAVQAAAEAPIAPDGQTAVIERVISEDVEKGADGKDVKKVRKIRMIRNGENISEEEMREIMIEVREELAEADRELAEAMKQHRLAMVTMRDAEGKMPHVIVSCDKDNAQEWVSKEGEGTKVVRICTADIMASAISGLESARASVAKDKNIPDDVREEVLRELDQQIKRWNEKNS